MKTYWMLLLTVAFVGPAMGGILRDREEKTPDQRREEIRKERDEIVEKVIAGKPEVKDKIKDAPGYATFSTVNLNILILATVRGSGVLVDKQNNKETFMSVTSLGGGIGAGIKDMRCLMIFKDQTTLEEFENKGWQFGGQTDAALKSGDKGVEAGESVAVAADSEGKGIDTALSGGAGDALKADTAIEVYNITEAGVSLQATINGTKYSKIDELNE